MKHPMQAIVLDKHGTARFQENSIIRHLVDTGVIDLIKLATFPRRFSNEDYMQLAQLMGYSVSGFGDLSYADPLVVRVADEIVEKIIKSTEKTMAEPNSPREAVEQHRVQQASYDGIGREPSGPGTTIVVAGSRFKVGDVVVLKSGGPNMTVWGFRPDSLIETCWFDKAILMRDAFAEAELDNAPAKA